MTPWAWFWTITFALSVLGFAFLAIKIGIGGWQDLKLMIRRLGEKGSD